MRPVLVVVAVFAVVTALLAWSRWLAGRRWAAAGHLVLACCAAVTVAAGWRLAEYVAAHEEWVPELPVAELYFEQTGSSRYRATLTRLPSGRMQVFDLAGDHWRLDLRTLAWSDRLVQFGPEPRYRIERLASRHARPDQPAAAYDLAGDGSPAPPLSGLRIPHGAPLLEARDVASPWQPLADGARFALRLTAAGAVETEPRNAAAAASLASR
jgi:hypothetical protein